MNTNYPELLLEKEKWEKPLTSLTSEVVVLLQKFSEMINEDVWVWSTCEVETNQLFIQKHHVYSGVDGEEGRARGSSDLN